MLTIAMPRVAPQFVAPRYRRLRDEEGRAQIDLLVDVPGLLVHAQRRRSQRVDAGGLDDDVGGARQARRSAFVHRVPGRRGFAQIGADAQRRCFVICAACLVDGGDLRAFGEQAFTMAAPMPPAIVETPARRGERDAARRPAPAADLRAFGEQAFHDGRADAAGRAGDDRPAAAKRVVARTLSFASVRIFLSVTRDLGASSDPGRQGADRTLAEDAIEQRGTRENPSNYLRMHG